MQPLDWVLVAGSLALVLFIGLYTQQYMKGVADFLSAGRVARRYLLAVSQGEMTSGALAFVGAYQVMSISGFTMGWWAWLSSPIGLLIAIFGFVAYRYRETRVLTLAQFFEVRYSKSLRLFAGLLGFCAGILNFGIIPSGEARFMVYVLGLPPELHIFGVTFFTFIPLMAFFLSINILITLTGGLITIMMTNCAEGIVSQVMFLVLIFGLISMFSWSQISYVMGHQPPGHSLLNPMDAGRAENFNIWYVTMNIIVGTYSIGAWQNRSGYSSAPLSAHEGRMGGIMGSVRAMSVGAVGTLTAVCTYTYLHHPDFAAGAAAVQAQLAKITNPQTQEQMTSSLALNHLLPTGMKGALCAICLMGVFGGDSTHLHSWGSLFIQDIIIPYRKKPFLPSEHILYLRLAMAGVALFAFLFGVCVPPSDYIAMWFAVTQGIFTSGAGAVIIGGLYWKKGTAAAAWSTLIIGSILSLAGIGVRQYYGMHFFLNGLQISFLCSIVATSVYVVISLLTCKEDFNMDRMLHRGAYATVSGELGDQIPKQPRRKLHFGKIIGFDENFTLGDKWIAGGLFAWSMLFAFITIVGTCWNLIWPWPLSAWSTFWHIVAVVIPVILAVVIGVWFIWGAIRDSLELFQRLRTQKVNPLDNGMVIDHQNLDESILPDAISPRGPEA